MEWRSQSDHGGRRAPPGRATPQNAPLQQLLTTAGFTPKGKGPAAVWQRPADSGEMIEFLTPLVGPAKLEGKPRALDGQPGIAALPLDRLQLLAEHTRELLIFSKPENTRVRVPTLGAYFLNKALTFNKRQATTAGSNPKRAKDLVYIRDLMAAGKEVRDAIRADLSDIVKTEKRAVRFAAGRVEGVIQPGGASPDLKEAARQLLEREQAEEESYWEQDLRANLTQAAQMLAQPKQKRLRRS